MNGTSPMSDKPSFYITTPIYYVNDAPHIGHAYTTVAADAISRYRRLKGHDVFFLTGTDEHGQKVMQAAKARGASPREHVDQLVEPFRKLWQRLDITNDDFIRTTEDRHIRVVQAQLQLLFDAGEIYKDSYSGWYSTSEERFWMEKDLVDGRCPLSGQPVEWITESNYFFKMSRYQDRLIEYIEKHPDFLQPELRRNEVLGYLRRPLDDLCISRPKSRLPWGITLPFDTDYVTYVWFDALLNYVSAPGLGSDPVRFQRYWPADFHLVGKDILTTHAVYWSTMLFALGLEPAKTLFAHGWWTIEGRKMSKSLKNVVDPNLLLDAYGSDALRYFLLREVAFGADGDFSHKSFQLRYNADLANDLGNLAHRTLSMTGRWLQGRLPSRHAIHKPDEDLEQLARTTVEQVDRQMEALKFHEALATTLRMVQAGNKYIDSQRPWSLNREGKMDRLATVMRNVLEICRIAAVLISPVCPRKSTELLAKLGTTLPGSLLGLADFNTLSDGMKVEAGDPLFPRMTLLPDIILAAMQESGECQEDQFIDPKKTKTGKKQQGSGRVGREKTQRRHKESSKQARTEPPHSRASTGGIPMISYDTFAKVRMLVGMVTEAEPHPRADRLLVLKVDVGEESQRTIVAGIANRYNPADLVGTAVVVVANLKPIKLRGIVSQGMLLAAGGERVEGLLTIEEGIKPGTIVH